MDTELVVGARLTRVASFLDADGAGTSIEDVVKDLRFCEGELVSRRFRRATAADGSPIRVRVIGADAALIHVTRALSLVQDQTHLDQAKASVEQAREEVAHMRLEV
jgi:hypothetical protein